MCRQATRCQHRKSPQSGWQTILLDKTSASDYLGVDGPYCRDIDTQTAAALAGISGPELIDLGVREGVIWTPSAGISKLSPRHRPPVLLTNMGQLEGSIEWSSRSVTAVSQSQPDDSIRLPQQDFLSF